MTNKELLELISLKSGFTIDLKTGLQPVTGYCIALKDFEQITTVNNDLDLILTEYIVKHKPKLLNNLSHYYLGCWLYDNKVYLDIVIVLKDLKLSVKFAEINKQIAIYDLDNQKEIFIKNLITSEKNDLVFTGNFNTKNDLIELINQCYNKGLTEILVNNQLYYLHDQTAGTLTQRKAYRNQFINSLANTIQIL